jgi:hypothetical protein
VLGGPPLLGHLDVGADAERTTGARVAHQHHELVGLRLTTSPATEAIMGALPEAKAKAIVGSVVAAGATAGGAVLALRWLPARASR